jgi:hypothetical protein
VVTAASTASGMTAATATTAMKAAAASHAVRSAAYAVGAACSMDACATISPMESPGNTYTAGMTR